MDEPELHAETENAIPAENRPWWRLASNIAWLVVSLGFVGFLLVGSLPVRTWRLGSLHIDSRSIAGVWRVQAESLPGQFPGWLESSLFIGSCVIFVVGVVAAFRLLLAPDPAVDA